MKLIHQSIQDRSCPIAREIALAGGRMRSLSWLLLSLFALGASSLEPPTAPPEVEQLQRSSAEWAEVLAQHAAGATQGRRLVREAARDAQLGQAESAAEKLDEAKALNPSDPAPYFEQARIQLQDRQPTALAEWLLGLRLYWSGALRQARGAAIVLLWINLVAAIFLVWLLVQQILRYIPFWQHQLAAKQDPRTHARSRNLLAWLPALLLPLITVAFGLVPSICILSAIVWLYAHRRARWLLGGILAWFALQAAYGEPFGSVFSALNPSSRLSLIVSAVEDAPTSGLLARVSRARAERPNDATLLFAEALVLSRSGQFARSNERFSQVLASDANDPLTLTNLANNHYYLGDVDRALAGYQKATKLDPSLGLAHHNLSQAYLRKMFMREGGEAMQRAIRLGFVPSRQTRPLPRGGVYYATPSQRELWKLAWSDRRDLLPTDLWSAAKLPLGVPAAHVGGWLLGTLALCWVTTRLLSRSRLVFECANCQVLSCRNCSGEHDGLVLCVGCAQTAKRARSEVVLSTLLRNRRHDAERASLARMRHWNTWFFGGGHLQQARQRGLVMGLWFSFCATLIISPSMPADPWAAPYGGGLPIARIIGVGGLLVLWVIAFLGRVPLRTPPLHIHPASLVSLGDLIEGRPRRRASA